MDSILHEINQFNQQVIHDEYTCSRHVCPHCHSPENSGFVKHQTVPRKYRVPIGDAIRIVESWRVRFRCLECRKTFSDYPTFALPHKRFVRPVVLEQAPRFLEDDQATYQDATHGNRAPLGYEAATEEKQLRGSTIWRWCTWLGSLKTVLQQAARLILEKHPQDNFHRVVYEFPAHKYRSPDRRELLKNAAPLLFQAYDRMHELFGVDIFTHFAINLRG